MIVNNLLMQFQSDIFQKKVISQDINEITALGAGAASFLFVNNLPLKNMNSFITHSKTWNPNMDSKQRIYYLNKWKKAINKSKKWI